MEVMIKCKCTDGEIKFPVRDRKPEEDILDYMEHVQTRIGSWHMLRGCSETALEYLKMPIAEGKGIGES